MGRTSLRRKGDAGGRGDVARDRLLGLLGRRRVGFFRRRRWGRHAGGTPKVGRLSTGIDPRKRSLIPLSGVGRSGTGVSACHGLVLPFALQKIPPHAGEATRARDCHGRDSTGAHGRASSPLPEGTGQSSRNDRRQRSSRTLSEAELLSENLSSTVPQQLTRVNWEVLPRGRRPWAELESVVRHVLDVQGPRKRPVFEHRWRTIAAFGPDFTAVGRAGSRGT